MRLLAALLLSVAFALPLSAAELVMVEEKWCEWCERWNEEVGVVYDKTDEGRRAPLRRVDIHDEFPSDLKFKLRPTFTPTFILFDNGEEIGRIEGYPGEDFFWGLFGQLLKKLDGRGSGGV